MQAPFRPLVDVIENIEVRKCGDDGAGKHGAGPEAAVKANLADRADPGRMTWTP